MTQETPETNNTPEFAYDIPQEDKVEIVVEDMTNASAKDYAASLGIQSVISEKENLDKNLNTNRKLFTYSIASNLLLLLLLIMMIIAFFAYPKTRYIPTKNAAEICEVTPENNPTLTDATISEFGKDAILNLYTFDYVNYEKQMNNTLDHFFTPNGRAATVKAMEEAGVTKYATDNALTFRATAMNSARIEERSKDSDNNTYWVVRFPMVLDIYSGKTAPISTQKHLVTVRVVAKTATAQNPNGLGVSSVTLEPIK